MKFHGQLEGAAARREAPSSSFIPRGQYQGELIIRNAGARGGSAANPADHSAGSLSAPASTPCAGGHDFIGAWKKPATKSCKLCGFLFNRIEAAKGPGGFYVPSHVRWVGHE